MEQILDQLADCPVCGSRPKFTDWCPVPGYPEIKLWAVCCSSSASAGCLYTGYARDKELVCNRWRQLCDESSCKDGKVNGALVVVAAIAVGALAVAVFL